MLKAAAIALPLMWRRPLDTPCPLLMDDAVLPPFDGIPPGFWRRVRGWQP